MILYILRGLPGSGKSTFAKSLGIFHVEMDMYFMRGGKYIWSANKIPEAAKFCQDLVRSVIKAGLDCVVSNTHTKIWEFQPYLDMAKELGADVRVIKMPFYYGSVHDVPDITQQKMKDRWEDFEDEITWTNNIA